MIVYDQYTASKFMLTTFWLPDESGRCPVHSWPITRLGYIETEEESEADLILSTLAAFASDAGTAADRPDQSLLNAKTQFRPDYRRRLLYGAEHAGRTAQLRRTMIWFSVRTTLSTTAAAESDSEKTTGNFYARPLMATRLGAAGRVQESD